MRNDLKKPRPPVASFSRSVNHQLPITPPLATCFSRSEKTKHVRTFMMTPQCLRSPMPPFPSFSTNLQEAISDCGDMGRLLR